MNIKSGINTKLLKQRIKDSGYMQGYLAKRLDISRQAFNNKVNGRSCFTAEESADLCNLLRITTMEDYLDIFLPQGLD